MRAIQCSVLLAFLIAARAMRGDSGVIIPSDRQAPDPAELAIESLKVHIKIDNGHATVDWDEVFRNKTAVVLEGTYLLSLPGNAAVSDFAVWDDVTRIPGVILERKRAGELYAQIRNEAIDPGLLQSGEITESTAPGAAAHSSQFSVKIAPISAYGYKRIEAQYRQAIPLNQLTSELVVPLKSSDANAQTVKRLSIEVELRSPQAITKLDSAGEGYPLKTALETPHSARGSYEAADVALNRDLTIRYTLTDQREPAIQAYRAGAEPGFFEASAILQSPLPAGKPDAAPRTVIVLFDSSLSMQWDKLERSFEALETTLRSLKPRDLFNVAVFNSGVAMASENPKPATPQAIAKALDFVRASPLRGGTNLQLAFEAAFRQVQANTFLLLLSDGELTEGTIAPARFNQWFEKSWTAIKEGSRPHIYALAIGDDANTRFVQGLTKRAGVFEQVRSTEPIEFKLNGLIAKMGLVPLDQVALVVSKEVKPRLLYRLESDDFPGSRASWAGEYQKPGEAEFVVNAKAGGRSTHEAVRARLPERSTEHAYLPAVWARARVDALLEKIDRDGEDRASIEEIIELSRKYHFVTPYTSFLAAPRALLRPRLIRPGDPLLRVRTDSSVRSVIALFPFGLVKPLRYLKAEDIWQTRFLAPADLADGTHSVRLIMRDTEGRVFREQKSFMISSHPPVVRVRLESARVRAGSEIRMRVEASETTRTIAVRLYGAEPVLLRWNASERANTGVLRVPAELPPGRYSLHLTAEDFAHNVSQEEKPVEVLP